jgi:hypothetical protein
MRALHMQHSIHAGDANTAVRVDEQVMSCSNENLAVKGNLQLSSSWLL